MGFLLLRAVSGEFRGLMGLVVEVWLGCLGEEGGGGRGRGKAWLEVYGLHNF